MNETPEPIVDEPAEEPVRCLSVQEGTTPAPAAGRPTAQRVFSVVLSAPPEDLEAVASAADPKSGLALPRAGDPHPADAGLLAEPPTIYDVSPFQAGRRTGRFFNVRVIYRRAKERP